MLVSFVENFSQKAGAGCEWAIHFHAEPVAEFLRVRHKARYFRARGGAKELIRFPI